MFGKTKRGQSALEYLVTYGWAILAIVIIAAVLWYFGIFNPTSFVGSKRCVGFSSFNCQDFSVSTTGALTIKLSNKVGGTVNNLVLTSSGPTGNAQITNATGTFFCDGSKSTPPRAGASDCVCQYVVASSDTATCTISNYMPAGKVGDSFDQTQISVSYVDARSLIAHTDSGVIQGKFE